MWIIRGIECVFEMVLFVNRIAGTKENGGIPITREMCPIAGRYRFKYNINDGSEEKIECNSFSSDLDNCPDGSILKLQFKRCSFESHGTPQFTRDLRNETTQDRLDMSEHLWCLLVFVCFSFVCLVYISFIMNCSNLTPNYYYYFGPSSNRLSVVGFFSSFVRVR